jgi:outer membrane protein assembly factor BamB
MKALVTRFVARLLSGVVLLAFLLSNLYAKSFPEVKSPEVLLDVIKTFGPAAGFCAKLGWGDGILVEGLCRNENLVVHVLEADPEKTMQARARLDIAGLYGQATVELWNETCLPYADNTINQLIVEATNIPEAELLRVVAPQGVLWVKRGSTWQPTVKPWPKEFDEWTHWRHAADGNMVSKDGAVQTPNSIRWIAGPPQDPGGRKWYYDHVLVTSGGRSFYLYEHEMVARDSFNGRLLWRLEAKAHTFGETGASVFPKPGSRVSKVRPVASGDRVYAVLEGKFVALDSVSGKTVQTFADVTSPREIMLSDGLLLLTDKNGIRAFSTGGPQLWQQPVQARRLVAGGGKAYFMEGNSVGCLDARTGQTLWRVENAKAQEAVTCTLYQDTLVLERASWRDDGDGNGVTVFSGKDGAMLWNKDYTPGTTHYKEARSFFAQGLVWLQQSKQRFVGYDPLTGQERKNWGSRGLHCAVPVATEKFLIAPELEFTDLETGTQSTARMVKSACRLPFIPANGLLYTFPVQCECFPMLRGYMGLSPNQPPGKATSARLQKGPAFARADQPVSGAPTEQWPMYRKDVYRSASTSSTLASGSLKKLWEIPLEKASASLARQDWECDPFSRSLVTPPVGDGRVVVVAVPHRHRIVALDALTGKTQWTFTAGGRVDTPPTLVQGRCVFGAHDGYVYCLSLQDGQLVWRFRAAPEEARIPAYGQMESLWPIAGGVLVDNGIAYLAAGRHPATDGGLTVCALRVANGELVWEKKVTDSGVTKWYSGMFPGTRTKVGLDYDPVDLLVKDGASVAMSRWQFNPANGEMQLAFTNVHYTAFDSVKVPRGVWSYGIRQTKMVLDKAPTAFNARGLTQGKTNETALILSGNQTVRADRQGEINLSGGQKLTVSAPVVHDGLMVVKRRLYAACQDGKVVCFGE